MNFINELKLVNSCCSGEVGAVCGNTDLLLLLGERVCVCVRVLKHDMNTI